MILKLTDQRRIMNIVKLDELKFMGLWTIKIWTSTLNLSPFCNLSIKSAVQFITSSSLYCRTKLLVCYNSEEESFIPVVVQNLLPQRFDLSYRYSWLLLLIRSRSIYATVNSTCLCIVIESCFDSIVLFFEALL